MAAASSRQWGSLIDYHEIGQPPGLFSRRAVPPAAAARLHPRRAGRRLADWWQALSLVRGTPFANQRPGGYGWLAARPVEHEYTAGIVDLAHAVATHHLAAGEPDRAEAAAKAALTAAAGSSDISLLDLVRACDAQDRRAEGDAHVRKILANHDTDDLEDLPPRAYDVLRRRQFLPPAA